MTEAGHTKTDAQGRFSFKLDDNDTAPHLVRVTHQGVSYFPDGGPISPGTSTVEVKVYDAAQNVEGLSTKIQAMRLQAEAGTLHVLELYAVENTSNPPRAMMSDRTYSITLPEGAELQQASAAGPGGMPVSAMPKPGEEKGQYFFAFPLRPGETRFQVAYDLPYPGKLLFQPHPVGNLEHLAVMLPKSMSFEPRTPGAYSSMPDETGQTVIQVATNITPGKDLAFNVSGTGAIAEPGESGQQADSQGGRPGGGLGNPEGTPDPLHNYRWPILGTLAALLAIGGIYVAKRSGRSESGLGTHGRKQSSSARSGAAGQKNALLEALKEELFQLEMDRQQGRITPEQYAASKAALDHTLQRAASRLQPAGKG